MTGSATAPSPASTPGPRPPLSARTAALWSVGAHLLLIVLAIVFTRLTLPPPQPPAYNVELVAAPPGPRALGSVQEGPSAPADAAGNGAHTSADTGSDDSGPEDGGGREAADSRPCAHQEAGRSRGEAGGSQVRRRGHGPRSHAGRWRTNWRSWS